MKTNLHAKTILLTLIISAFFNSCHNEEVSTYEYEILKVKNWFQNNHNDLIEQNNYYKGEVDWVNVIQLENKYYIPLSGTKNQIKIFNSENKGTNKANFYPFILLEKKNELEYKESFIVFVDKSNLNFELTNEFINLNLPYMHFDENNDFLGSSFSNKSENIFNSTTSLYSNCQFIDWFLVTRVNRVVVSEIYVGTTRSCNDPGFDDGIGSGGGGASPSVPQDYWSQLTECEKNFFRTNSPGFLTIAYNNRKKAENASANRFGNCKNANGEFSLRNNIGDAYRHAYFSALNAQNSSLGYVKAKQLGDAHECETPTDELDEKTMDLHNNAWGYSFAGSNQYFTEAMFYSAFMTAFENGEIKILENCD